MINLYKKYGIKNTGLFILPAPTGSGKTTQAVNYMYEYLTTNKKVRNKDKIVFSSNRKETSFDPMNKLIEKIEALHAPKEAEHIKKEILALRGEQDQFKVFFTKTYAEGKRWNAILPLEILDDAKKQFMGLENLLRHGTQLEEDDIYKLVREKIKGCKGSIDKYLKKKISEAKGNAERIYREEREWLIHILPAYYFNEFSIVFCTFKKLLSGAKHREGYKNLFFGKGTSNIEENFLFIIDEFDATKKILLDHLTEEKGIPDLIGSFNKVSGSISNKFPNIYKDSILGSHLRLENEIKEMKKAYHFSHPLKADGFSLSSEYIFKDDDYLNSRNINRNSTVLFDEDSQCSLILDPSDEKSLGDKKSSLLTIVRRTEHYVRVRFPALVDRIIQNHIQNKEEEKLSIDRENIVYTVVNRFGIKNKEDYIDLIKHIDMLHNMAPVKKIPRDKIRHFYERGFALISFSDASNHELETYIHVESMILTPEQALLAFCQKNRVIGISATSELHGLVNNYDLDFIQARLGEKFEILDAEEIEYIEKSIEKRKDFSKVDTRVYFVQEDTSLDGMIYKLFEKWIGPDKNGDGPQLKSMLESNGKAKYLNIRMLNTVYILIEFIENDMDSFVYFGNATLGLKNATEDIEKILRRWLINRQKHYHNDDISQFGKKDRFNFWKHIDEKDWVDTSLKKIMNMIVTIDAKSFSRGEYLSKAKKEERFFAYTTYASLKDGVNLHYPFDNKELENSHVVYIGKEVDISDEIKKKDINGLYLEKPTYLVDGSSTDGYNIRKDLYHFLSIYNTALDSGSLVTDTVMNQAEKRKIVNTLFKKNQISKTENPERISSSLIYNFYTKNLPKHFACDLAALVKQTVGRGSRSLYKNNQFYIYLDNFFKDPLATYSNLPIADRTMHLEEFDAILNLLYADGDIRNMKPENSFYLHAKAVNDRGVKDIHHILNIFAKKETLTMETLKKVIMDYEEMGELLLKYPVLKSLENIHLNNGDRKEEVSPPMYMFLKLENKKTSLYSFTGDPEEPTEIQEDSGLDTIVSDDFLRKICRVENAKEYMESKGFATEWSKGQYIMSPVMYNNIYKGRLGEVLGEYFLKRLFPELKLNKLDEREYEILDAKTNNNIYFDFKNYSNTTINSAELNLKVREKLLPKLNESSVSKIVLVNLSGLDNYVPVFYDKNFSLVSQKDAFIMVIPNLVNLTTETINSKIIDNKDLISGWLQ